MESTVAALLLVTASVVLACVVVGYSISLTQSSLTDQSYIEGGLSGLVNNTATWLNSFDGIGNSTTSDPGT